MTDDDINNSDLDNSDPNNSDLERQLRESLHRLAEQISPRERRTEILAMVHDETQVGEPRRRWLMPVAAAASVALIGGAIAWGMSNKAGSPQTSPAAPTTSTTGPAVPGPVPGPNPSPSPSTTSNVAPPGASTQMALPAYFVGANSGVGDRFGLYREFVRTAVPAGATPAQKAKAAIAVAMNAQQFTNVESYLQPWSGTSVQEVTVTPSLITITLSGPGAKGFTTDQAKLAVQELVWTAQAAIQRVVPVKFVVADGSTSLFGTYPTAKTYNRPPKDDPVNQDLAPIWVTSPERGQVLPAGAPVVAKGESCAFEANTLWQLKKDGTPMRDGFATASSGCPMRGTWEVKLGVLAPGNYTFRMFEVNMADGKGLVAETSKPFTVK